MTDKSHWFSVKVTVETEAADAVVFALSELGAEGTSYSLLAKPANPAVTVSGYFEQTPEKELIRSKVVEALQIYGFENTALIDIESHAVEDQDWLAEWKKFWKPTVTEKFIVAPPWEDVSRGERIVIVIEPKMAFGTGTHETTRLCLKEIEALYRPGMSFLDVGTGTGILAIAAAKLAAGEDAKIAACDTDPEAVSAAKENAELNGCPGIELFEGSINETTPQFDFICANLTTDVILSLLPTLLAKTRTTLVLSGILEEKKDAVTDALSRSGVDGAAVKQDGEWVAVTVRKPG